jgi:hypothetical protein
MNKHNLLKLAEATHDLIAEATTHEKLELLSSLAVEVKAVLDFNDNHYHNVHPDLGLDLVEFAQLKRDGIAAEAKKFGDETVQTIEDLRAED